MVERNAATSARKAIKASVIIPVYRHWNLIPDLLECISAQTFARESFDVLLVDNGSPDFELPAGLPANTAILHCSAPGSYAARNYGLKHATGEWLVFTDADCRPKPDWLENLLEERPQEAAAPLRAGAVTMYAASQPPNAYAMYDMVKGIPQAHYVSRGYAATANLAVRKSVFTAVGQFDASRFSGGDADFCRRATRAGFRLAYRPEAIVEHPARASWGELATKARRVKGGQLKAGSIKRRVTWLIRTLTPPVRAYLRFWQAKAFPRRYRLTAIAIQTRIWMAEIVETVRLVIRPAERR